MKNHLRQVKAEQEHVATAHLWVGSVPFFESTLLVMPDEESQFVGQLAFYDADGQLFNECALTCPGKRGLELELKPFLESCKFQSGWKHAHVAISSSQKARYACRLSDGERASIYEPARVSTLHVAHVLPLTFLPHRKNILSLVSAENAEIKVRLRLFIDNRKPEHHVLLTPNASQLYCIEELFSEFSDTEEEGVQKQAYLRISAQGAPAVTITQLQLNERLGAKETFTIGGLL